MFDFHAHTFLRDGVLSPIELIRRAMHIGYKTMAITDNVGPGNLDFILTKTVKSQFLLSLRFVGFNGLVSFVILLCVMPN